ncbi:Glucan endo-1,3-beta-glucosidase 11 [Linum grandiflorum]
MELHTTPFLLLLSLLLSLSAYSVDAMGINYGQIANNLPSPADAVPLIKAIGATKVKLYDASPNILRAFSHSNIEFVIGLGNEYLSKMAADPNAAVSWVKTNVQTYLPATNITCIAVGNEVLTLADESFIPSLLPALQSIRAAVVSLNLQNQVTVTTPHSLAVLQTSYPPSSGLFRRDLIGCISKILDFNAKSNSPFLINAYPYFAYKANPKQVSLDFVLFQPNQGIVDPVSNLHYDNMLFAQIDAVHYALASLGYKDMPVHISETGWPSKGDADEAGATPENAKKYNGNLIKTICQRKGTPARPNLDLNIYVFALFNENLKSGPTSERNYGLFKPDGTPAYSIGIDLPAGNSNRSSPASTTPTAHSPPSLDGVSPPVGYLAITGGGRRIKVSSLASSFLSSSVGILMMLLVQLYG